MLGMSALAVASALALAATPLQPPMTVFLIAMFALTGGLLNAVQTTMYALAAHVYPTGIRATGVGTAVAVGRLGNVLASYAGTFALMAMFLVTGGLLNAVQTTMYALAAHVYPTEIRGTGVGSAVAFGRIGNVLAANAGNYALDRGGNPAYFNSWALTMGLVFVALAAIGRHIPKTSGVPAQVGVRGARVP